MWVKNAGHPYSTWILNSKGNDAKHNLRKPKNMFWEFEKKSFQNSKTPLSAAFQSSSLFSVDWRVENISNSGGSHGLLGMQNSGFEKKRKKKIRTEPVFRLSLHAISFSCSSFIPSRRRSTTLPFPIILKPVLSINYP